VEESADVFVEDDEVVVDDDEEVEEDSRIEGLEFPPRVRPTPLEAPHS